MPLISWILPSTNACWAMASSYSGFSLSSPSSLALRSSCATSGRFTVSRWCNSSRSRSRPSGVSVGCWLLNGRYSQSAEAGPATSITPPRRRAARLQSQGSFRKLRYCIREHGPCQAGGGGQLVRVVNSVGRPPSRLQQKGVTGQPVAVASRVPPGARDSFPAAPPAPARSGGRRECPPSHWSRTTGR